MESEAGTSAEAGGGYHYWHNKVPDGAPQPEHTPVTVAAATSAPEDTAITIDNFAFMDDDSVVKVYVTLAGDLEGVTADAVEFSVEAAKFDPTCSMLLHVRGKKHLHRLYVSHLLQMVVPEQCKFKVNASKAKLIITLKKANDAPWHELRSKVVLPYRRGGGGAPR